MKKKKGWLSLLLAAVFLVSGCAQGNNESAPLVLELEMKVPLPLRIAVVKTAAPWLLPN